MAEMYPNYIDQTDPKRNGERMVFNWFSQSSISGAVFYSMRQKNHKYKLVSEVDFLYVCNRGLLCVEVKGGQDIFRKDRKWFSKNRNGINNTIHNPFEQALGCQYALKEYLSTVYGKSSEQAKFLCGYAVVFPECIFTGKGNDLLTEVVFDGHWSLSDFPKYLDQVFDYWEEQEIKKHHFHPKHLSGLQVSQIIDLLRGDFFVVPSLKLELQNVEMQMLTLTEEQYDVLYDIELNERSIVLGAAGTGKTLLAIELVRKTLAKGLKVLYVCYNHNMMLYAKSSLKDNPLLTVSTYHKLCKEMLSDSSISYKSLSELSAAIITEANASVNNYDCVIVDEGQDLFEIEVFEVFDLLLTKGMKNGKWTVFLDPNQNIFHSEDNNYDETLALLREIYSPTIKTLFTNCRNTEQIARRTSMLTLTPPAKYLRLSGPIVITRLFNTRDEFLKMLKKELQSLLSSGISYKDIVILSTRKKANSLLSNTSSLCNLTIVENAFINSKCIPNCINYFTVQSFKGLESKIIFYVDIDGFESLSNRMMNYVGMSRAKLRLYLFYNQSLRKEYTDILDKGEDLFR